MVLRLVLMLAVLAGVVLLLRWFTNTPPATVRKRLLQAAVVVAIAALILLAATGRLHWLLALGASLLPLMRKWLPLLRYAPIFKGLAAHMKGAQAAKGPPPGQRSEVETAYLRMILDHDSGEMDGVVLKGAFQGQHLGALTIEQLLQLWSECQREDQNSISLLETYLDRIHPDWRASETGRDNQPSAGSMSRDEAYEVLGLQPGASKDAIIEAHRRLMQKVHPDRGGSTYLAAQLNQAKDVLLRK